jgi:hypothetical protein
VSIGVYLWFQFARRAAGFFICSAGGSLAFLFLEER